MKYTIAVLVLLIAGCIIILVLGCGIMKRTRIPIRSISWLFKHDQLQTTLFVFLQGRHSIPEDYETNGFIDMVKNSGIKADCIAIDAHFGYYFKRNLLTRILDDVVTPSQQKGYRNIWLVGISMGGLGSLLYTIEHGETITGVCVLAPFLGDTQFIDEIYSAGGLATWSPSTEITPKDYQRYLWKGLKQYVIDPNRSPIIYLGYGTEDTFAQSNKLLANVLPQNQVFTTPGSHTWAPWKKLFAEFLKDLAGNNT